MASKDIYGLFVEGHLTLVTPIVISIDTLRFKPLIGKCRNVRYCLCVVSIFVLAVRLFETYG